jgi:hypothetical protein
LILGLALPLLLAYLILGALVVLRSQSYCDPDTAAQVYLEALRSRRLDAIYLYSELLGARLAGLTEGSDLGEEQRQQLWAKDFTRFTLEFNRGAGSMDSLRRERLLLSSKAAVAPAAVKDYRAEVKSGQELNLVSYRDVEGEGYHRYYRISYPSPDQAPPVGLLDNVQTGRDRLIRSVIIRVQVLRRPEVGWLKAQAMRWGRLDQVASWYPFLSLLPPAEPSRIWMVGVSFTVDKTTLETF